MLPDRDAGDDSDGSIITMGGNVQETSSEEEDEEDNYDDSDDEEEDNGKVISAQAIMSKINSAVHTMADEAEQAGKTALKMYDMLLEQAEKRKREGA